MYKIYIKLVSAYSTSHPLWYHPYPHYCCV